MTKEGDEKIIEIMARGMVNGFWSPKRAAEKGAITRAERAYRALLGAGYEVTRLKKE